MALKSSEEIRFWDRQRSSRSSSGSTHRRCIKRSRWNGSSLIRIANEVESPRPALLLPSGGRRDSSSIVNLTIDALAVAELHWLSIGVIVSVCVCLCRCCPQSGIYLGAKKDRGRAAVEPGHEQN